MIARRGGRGATSARRRLVLALVLAAPGCRDRSPPPEVAGGAGTGTSSPSPASSRPAAPPVRKDGTVYAEGVLMGTRVSFNVWLPPGQSAEAAGSAIEAAFAEVDRIEGVLSEWRPSTELSRLNAAALGTSLSHVSLSKDLCVVLAAAQRASERTEGAFDVTFHGVGRLWRFEPGARPPDRAAVERALSTVGYDNIRLNEEDCEISTLRPGVQIGLGAIAKGYAVDRASALLVEKGFPDHIVEAGGDTFVRGTKGGRPWVVGVQDPDAQGPIGILEVKDRAVVTSGDYQRFFEYEGRRYAHILDPRTGYPVPEDRAPTSVTVVAPNAMTADAYATAVAVLGTRKGMDLVERLVGIEAIVIGQDGTVHVSTGLHGIFRMVRPPPAPNEGVRTRRSVPPASEGAVNGTPGKRP